MTRKLFILLLCAPLAISFFLVSGCGGKKGGNPVVSNPSYVTSTGKKVQSDVESIVRLDELVEELSGSPEQKFDGMQVDIKALLNKLDALRKILEKADYKAAVNKLENDIIPKVPECEPKELTEEEIEAGEWDFCGFQMSVREKSISILWLSDPGTLVSAQNGGIVKAKMSDAVVSIPPGALNHDTIIRIVPLLVPEDVPENTPDDLPLMNILKLEPAEITFSKPVSVTLPLEYGHEAGETLEIKYYDEANPGSGWQDLGNSATVNDGGKTATVKTSHFSSFGVLTSYNNKPGNYLITMRQKIAEIGKKNPFGSGGWGPVWVYKWDWLFARDAERAFGLTYVAVDLTPYCRYSYGNWYKFCRKEAPTGSFIAIYGAWGKEVFKLGLEELEPGNVLRGSIGDIDVLGNGERILVVYSKSGPTTVAEINMMSRRVVWSCPSPDGIYGIFDADRLSNGNTLITSQRKVFEIDRECNIVKNFNISLNSGDFTEEADGLNDGTTVVSIKRVSHGVGYLYATIFNANGVELWNRRVGQKGLGGSDIDIDLVRNRLLVCPVHYMVSGQAGLVEYDMTNWISASLYKDNPNRVCRLPDCEIGGPITEPLSAIFVNPSSVTLDYGETQRFQAQCIYGSSPPVDCTNTVTWSADDSIGEIIAGPGAGGGLLTAAATAGSGHVTASLNDISGTANVTVSCLIACNADTDCDDGNPGTTDTCVNPGTCGAQCSNVVTPSCQAQVVPGFTNPGYLNFVGPELMSDDFSDGVWNDRWILDEGSSCLTGPDETLGNFLRVGTSDNHSCEVKYNYPGGYPGDQLFAQVDFNMVNFSGVTGGVRITYRQQGAGLSITWAEDDRILLCSQPLPCVNGVVPFPASGAGTIRISYDPTSNILTGAFNGASFSIPANVTIPIESVSLGVEAQANTTITADFSNFTSNINMGNYRASLSPLNANNIDYNAITAFMFYPINGQIIQRDNTPVLADGTRNVNAALVDLGGGVRGTLYVPFDQTTTAGLLANMLPTASIDCFIENVFLQNGSGFNYGWGL